MANGIKSFLIEQSRLEGCDHGAALIRTVKQVSDYPNHTLMWAEQRGIDLVGGEGRRATGFRDGAEAIGLSPVELWRGECHDDGECYFEASVYARFSARRSRIHR